MLRRELQQRCCSLFKVLYLRRKRCTTLPFHLCLGGDWAGTQLRWRYRRVSPVFGILVSLLSGWVFRKALRLEDKPTTTPLKLTSGHGKSYHYAPTGNQSRIRIASQRSQMLASKIDTCRSKTRHGRLSALRSRPRTRSLRIKCNCPATRDPISSFFQATRGGVSRAMISCLAPS